VRALDCVNPVRQPAEQSVAWLLGHEVAFLGGPFADCVEPELAGKLAAMGYTHLLVRHDGSRHLPPPQEGFRILREFPDGRVLGVVAGAALVYTVDLRGFGPREPDVGRTRRWMASEGTWTVMSTAPGPLDATLTVELTPFPISRRVDVDLDGQTQTQLAIPAGRHRCRIGPLRLWPGYNHLTFRSPAPAGQPRPGSPWPVSLAVGPWRWTAAAAPLGSTPPVLLPATCAPLEP
jgi:hypothetical protein